MIYRQIVTPNLDPTIYDNGKVVTDWLGWCLGFVRAAFSPTPYAGYTAWEAWTQTTKYTHEDRNFPTGVYFIIWFKHWGTYVDGRTGKSRTGDWGHVAIAYKNPDTGAINIWSSPVTHKPFADSWTSIEAVEAHYNCTFVGWSEDIAGMRVIQPVDKQTIGGDVLSADEVKYGYLAVTGDNPTAEQLRYWTGRPVLEFMQALYDGYHLFIDGAKLYPSTKQALDAAQQQADKFGNLNVELSGEVGSLEAQLTKSQAETKAIKEGYTKLQEQTQTPTPTTAPGLKDYSLGELLSAAFSKLFKIK